MESVQQAFNLDYANGITPIPAPEQLSLEEAASLFEVRKEEPGMFQMLIFVMKDG